MKTQQQISNNRWRVGVVFLAVIGMLAMLAWQTPVSADEHEDGEDEMHTALLDENLFPSASKCKSCHEDIYREWASSNHAYAAISPMFHKFEDAINALAPTINAFCVRCHISTGTAMGEPREMAIWDRSQVSREGVTCITCHRVGEAIGRANGERRIAEGTIFEPVFGNIGGDGVAAVVADAGSWKVATNEEERGNQIHTAGVKFDQLSQSEFCVSCHQVAVNLGIKLEVVWEQYRDSPAHKEGVSCQDCHMSYNPGIAGEFKRGPVAVVDGRPVNPDRIRHDHSFAGPGYPIAHPGIFPHNPEAENWTMQEWLEFNWRQPWGDEDWEDEYEEAVDEGTREEIEFPEVWEDRFDREEARAVVEYNLELIEEKKDLRERVMENGSHIDGPFFDGQLRVGEDLDFHYVVTNTNKGHNLPSGSLGAQPELWFNVALIDPEGNNVWESGYVDSNGDMADQHSLDVLAGDIPFDDQLVNLQTKFLTTNVKGTDREMYLPVNFDLDQLPFLRPAAQPTTVINHPPFVRMEGRSIPPLASRDINYSVPSSLVTEPGTYKLAIRMRSRAEPIYFMRFVGATTEMERSMNEWMMEIDSSTVEFEIEG
ncbi:MAG: multiheme c-type cytochrome [Alphaproteobacteria bacterium]